MQGQEGFSEYSINLIEKRKLKYRRGPHVLENNLDKKRNKFEKFSITIHDELKELHATDVTD